MKIIKAWYNIKYVPYCNEIDIEENDTGQIRTRWTLKDSEEKGAWGGWKDKFGGSWCKELLMYINNHLPDLNAENPNEEQSEGIIFLKKWKQNNELV